MLKRLQQPFFTGLALGAGLFAAPPAAAENLFADPNFLGTVTANLRTRIKLVENGVTEWRLGGSVGGKSVNGQRFVELGIDATAKCWITDSNIALAAGDYRYSFSAFKQGDPVDSVILATFQHGPHRVGGVQVHAVGSAQVTRYGFTFSLPEGLKLPAGTTPDLAILAVGATYVAVGDLSLTDIPPTVPELDARYGALPAALAATFLLLLGSRKRAS